MTVDEFTKHLDEIAKQPDGDQIIMMMDLVKGMLTERFGGRSVADDLEQDMVEFLRPFYSAIVEHPTLTRAVREDYSGRMQ